MFSEVNIYVPGRHSVHGPPRRVLPGRVAQPRRGRDAAGWPAAAARPAPVAARHRLKQLFLHRYYSCMLLPNSFVYNYLILHILPCPNHASPRWGRSDRSGNPKYGSKTGRQQLFRCFIVWGCSTLPLDSLGLKNGYALFSWVALACPYGKMAEKCF